MKNSFHKRADSYTKNCDIQNDIARILLQACLHIKPLSILDLGAGSGNITKNIDFQMDYLLAVDISPKMLSLHPKQSCYINKIDLQQASFEDFEFQKKFDLLISSSALHWANDLESILKKIKDSHCFKYLAFALFTNKSLEELHHFLGTKSPLLSSEDFKAIFDYYFASKFKVMTFQKYFQTNKQCLDYLKNSGLLGGGNLSFFDKKRLKFDYPFSKANFEVLFVVSDLSLD